MNKSHLACSCPLVWVLSHQQRSNQLSLSFPVDAKLKDGSPVQLVLTDEWDVVAVAAAVSGDRR